MDIVDYTVIALPVQDGLGRQGIVQIPAAVVVTYRPAIQLIPTRYGLVPTEVLVPEYSVVPLA